MAKAKNQLAKDIFGAGQLIDLAMCLADYIWMESWEGEDTTDLKNALETIKTAAADELMEPENFPEPLASAVEMAAKALNITKVEELKQMADSKKELEVKKDVFGEQKRDADGKFVASDAAPEAPAETPAEEAPKKEPVKVTVNKPEAEKPAAKVETEAPAKEEPAKTEPAKVEPAAPVEEPASEPATEAPAAPAAAEPEKAAEAGDLSKLPQADLLKSVGDIVKAGVAEAMKPLEERLAKVEAQPVDSKVKAEYATVEKAANANTEMGTSKAKFDELYARAQELAANPSLGTPLERMQVGKELRKLSRLMDPVSRAKHAAVKAAFQTPEGPQFIER